MNIWVVDDAKSRIIFFLLLSFTEKKVNKESHPKSEPADFVVALSCPARAQSQRVRTFLGVATRH
jgi:hypothetical protein